MTRLFQGLLALLVCVVVVYLLLFGAVEFYGQSWLESVLGKNFHRPVTVRSVRLQPFPLGIVIEGLRVRGGGEVRRMIAEFPLTALLTSEIHLTHLIMDSFSGVLPLPLSEKQVGRSLLIDRIEIRHLPFEEPVHGPWGTVEVKGNGDEMVITPFRWPLIDEWSELKGKGTVHVAGMKGPCHVSFQGRLNLFRRDFDGDASVVCRDPKAKRPWAEGQATARARANRFSVDWAVKMSPREEDKAFPTRPLIRFLQALWEEQGGKRVQEIRLKGRMTGQAMPFQLDPAVPYEGEILYEEPDSAAQPDAGSADKKGLGHHLQSLQETLVPASPGDR